MVCQPMYSVTATIVKVGPRDYVFINMKMPHKDGMANILGYYVNVLYGRADEKCIPH
jgi:hypothetical protein